MMKLILVGTGKWGQRYLSTLENFPEISVTTANRSNWRDLVNEGADGVIVCTHPDSHIEISKFSLERSIPVMVEKPLCFSSTETDTISGYSTPILVNHTHLFSNDYQFIKTSLSSPITKIVSKAGGNNEPRTYSNLWDYGPHDLSMILDLLGAYPNSIRCYQTDERDFSIELWFGDIVSYTKIGLFPSKVRLFEVYAEAALYKYDGLFSKDKPLTNALEVFMGAIKGKSDNRLGLDLSVKVVRILEECQRQIDILNYNEASTSSQRWGS